MKQMRVGIWQARADVREVGTDTLRTGHHWGVE